MNLLNLVTSLLEWESTELMRCCMNITNKGRHNKIRRFNVRELILRDVTKDIKYSDNYYD